MVLLRSFRLFAAVTATWFTFAVKEAGGETPRAVLKANDEGCIGVAFSPDSALVASELENGTIQIWETPTGREWFSIPMRLSPADGISASICMLRFSPDGQKLAWGIRTTAHILDLKKKQRVIDLGGHEDNVRSVAFHPTSSILATGTNAGVIRLWNLETKQPQVILNAEKANRSDFPRIEALVFDSSGDMLCAGCLRKLFFIDLKNGAKVRETKVIPDRNVVTLAMSPDGKVLAGGGQKVTLWETSMAKEIGTIPIFPHSLAFSPDGKKLAVGVNRGTRGPQFVKIWDVEGMKELFSFVCHDRSLSQLAWAPDGTTLATAASDSTVKLWAVSNMLKSASKR